MWLTQRGNLFEERFNSSLRMGTANFSKPSLNRVQTALHEFELLITVRQVSDSTRTAEDVASVIGCCVAQIVKSLVSRGRDTG